MLWNVVKNKLAHFCIDHSIFTRQDRSLLLLFSVLGNVFCNATGVPLLSFGHLTSRWMFSKPD